MTATAPAKAPPKHETWADWMHPDTPFPSDDELLTRSELIERLDAIGAGVRTLTLRRWEAAGVIPRTVRRWHKDAVHGVYPPWMVSLVFVLRELQQDGYSLDEIRQRFQDDVRPRITNGATDPLMFSGVLGNDSLIPAVSRFMERHKRLTGHSLESLKITVPGNVDGTPRLTIKQRPKDQE